MTDHLAMLSERTLATGFLLIGASHALWPERWGKLFADLFARGNAELTIATLTLPFALLILFAHPGWTPDARSIVTLYAWLVTLKCAVYLLAPGAGKRLTPERLASGRGFRPVGVVMGALGALVWGASLSA